MKKLFKQFLFGKPLYMSVYEDKYGNKYGGVIHKDFFTSVMDNTSYIDEPKFLGKIEIY